MPPRLVQFSKDVTSDSKVELGFLIPMHDFI
jgi:hypothetical protein